MIKPKFNIGDSVYESETKRIVTSIYQEIIEGSFTYKCNNDKYGSWIAECKLKTPKEYWKYKYEKAKKSRDIQKERIMNSLNEITKLDFEVEKFRTNYIMSSKDGE